MPNPPNYPVTVTYHPQAPKQFTFAPPKVTIEVVNSTVTFSSPNDSLDFTNFRTDPPTDDFTIVSTGSTMVVEDSDADAGTYEYQICIDVDGQPVWSPDPQIINKKPSG